MTISKQIIAAGGDIITDNAMNYYILSQANSEKPKVCLLPTPSGDSSMIIRTFYEMFRKHNCKTDHVSLFSSPRPNFREFLLDQDIIIVCGGQSKSCLGVFKEWGLDKTLKEAYEKGVILSGGSAGSVIWHDEALTDSFGDLRPMKFMGYLPFSNCPHYRSSERRVKYREAILNRQIGPGYAISDGGAIHYKDDKFFRAIASDNEASCFYVDIDSKGNEEKIHSERLPIHNLYDREVQEKLIFNSLAFKYLDAPEPETTKKEDNLSEWPEENEMQV